MTAILDLPDWGEVRVWVASRPLTSVECRQACQHVQDFLAAWQKLSVSWLATTPQVSDCEVFAQQALAFGYAAMWPARDAPERLEPYRMTGSDIDPLIDALDHFALRQAPPLKVSSDNAVIVAGVMSPMSKSLRTLAAQGLVNGGTLVMSGGDISSWRNLGAIHAFRDDLVWFAFVRQSLASQGISVDD